MACGARISTASGPSVTAARVLHWDGSKWSTQSSGATNNLQAVWGADADNSWIVGELGTILRWDGSKWSTQSSGATNNLQAVWGADADNIWAVGDGGTILRWDGTAWSTQSSGTTGRPPQCVGNGRRQHLGRRRCRHDPALARERLAQAEQRYDGRTPRRMGNGRSNMWAVGSQGTILRWDGNKWRTLSSGTTNNLHAVWGADVRNVWAVGEGGTILRWDGSKWRTQSSGTTNNLYAVWGADARNVWAVGDTLLKWDGSKWSAQGNGEVGGYGVWGTDVDNVWTVMSTLISTWDGSKWSKQISPATNGLLAVWGVDAHNVWVVGNAGAILNWTSRAP